MFARVADFWLHGLDHQREPACLLEQASILVFMNTLGEPQELPVPVAASRAGISVDEYSLCRRLIGVTTVSTPS